jgi:peptidoglycan/xylan/chitin deacetylase (PgdA/CDA1 family)
MNKRSRYTGILTLLFMLLVLITDAQGDDGLTVVGDEIEFVGKIIITIDDCSNESIAEEMFEILDSRGLNGTFFCNTFYLSEQTPEFWIRVLQSDWEFGYHTTDHTRGLSYEELDSDFESFQSYLREFLDEPELQVLVTRPPWGDWNDI